MKKESKKPGDHQKLRRLVLNRETLQLLDDPASLRLVGGGSKGDTYDPSITTTENTIC